MNNRKHFWTSVALINLGIVAMLGLTLRSKILFPLEGVDFKFVLHAHSHFAFGGWISLALLSLLIYEVLPADRSSRKIYHYLLWGIFLNAAGMLISFLCQGYAFFSILYSTLFIFVTYALAWFFTRDILRSGIEKSITILSITAMICLVLSSVGPFTLAYLMASKSGNHLLFRDSIYTYLHFQYNGFFTLSVFALLLHTLHRNIPGKLLKKVRSFALLLSLSVFPSLFISYLWHFPGTAIRTVAIAGCILVLATVVYWTYLLFVLRPTFNSLPTFVRRIGVLSMIAFLLKSLLQTGTVIPGLGTLVFGDRAIIIGYLHLVLLGFVSLYILAHFLHNGLLLTANRLTRSGMITFASAIIANETVLMVQGFGNMLMIGNNIYTWLLWIVSIWLFAGAMIIIGSRMFNSRYSAGFDYTGHSPLQSSIR